MENKIKSLVEETSQKAMSINSKKALYELKVGIVGKTGELTNLLRNLKDLSVEERPIIGKFVNEARETLDKVFFDAQTRIDEIELNAKLLSEKIDISIDKPIISAGGLHPITQIKNKIIDFFLSLGFMVEDSPEIETDYYNFEALNIAEDHPAREVQDTFFITNKFLLRSQTSTGQIRTMEQVKPPIKMISPGRVYRSDDPDATHSPMFHQLEGLVVDKNITMCDLKGILDMFAKEFFGKDTKTRFRPSYFPFTEPSVEVDASCSQCNGSGCRVCKGTGWIEILGAGIVNRNVLKNCKIDPDIYSGFAFGMGLDRITNIVHGISDLRVVFENDIRFLKQFN